MSMADWVALVISFAILMYIDRIFLDLFTHFIYVDISAFFDHKKAESAWKKFAFPRSYFMASFVVGAFFRNQFPAHNFWTDVLCLGSLALWIVFAIKDFISAARPAFDWNAFRARFTLK
jgi:hypothetical protein